MPDRFFAVTAPGLDGLAAEELRRLKIQPKKELQYRDEGRRGEDEGGGIGFEGGLRELYRANLHLRTASRVLVRLGDFYAAGFPELRKRAAKLDWERYLRPGQAVDLRVTAHKSRLYHSGAVAERVLAAIGDRLGGEMVAVKGLAAGELPPKDASTTQPPQVVIVRLVRDHCTISVDSSGELLHRRGYRLATAKAPLRETLAAALLLASGWDRTSPLVDPFCGSGTIPIEAAMMALGIPPGQGRDFAFMHWPGYDVRHWQALLGEKSPGAPGECPPIQASDRDAGAVRLAQENAARAGVADCIVFSVQAVSAAVPPPGPGWVVTNPPYGIRVSGSKDLRNLYAQLGNVLRARFPAWQAAILSSDPRLLGQVGFALDTSLSFVNGGISVRLGRGTVPTD